MQIFEQQDQKKLDSLMAMISAFGISRHKINRISHSVFDAATALVFDDAHRLKPLLSEIWKPLDVVQAEILTAQLRRLHPAIASDIEALPKKNSNIINNDPAQPITVTGMKLLLGVTSRVWKEFLQANKRHNKKNYSFADLEQIRQPIIDFAAKTTKKKLQFESKIVSSCSTLAVTSKRLGLTHAECRILSEKGLLTPIARIRTRPYYQKNDINVFQTAFISTRMLATRLKVTHTQIITALNRCKTIKPLINHSGAPYLVRTEEIPTVLQSLKKIPPKTNSLRDQLKINRCTTEHLQTLTLDQVAEHLKVHRSSVIYYRDLGLIRCSTDNSRVFVRDDVVSFYDRFATPRILGRELYLAPNKICRILERHNIHGLSGQLVNGNANTIFDRKHLPENLYALINPTHDTFGVCLSLNQVMTLRDAAKALGITYGDVRKLFSRDIRPSRAAQYRGHGSISHDEISSIRKNISSLSKLSDVLDNFNITHAAFSRRFVFPGFVHPLKLNNQKFLTPTDSIKLNAFMGQYCSPTDAAKILGLSSAHISLLMKQRTISSYRVPGFDYPHPFVKRIEVQALLELRVKDLPR
ncbi:hypothetical protein U9R80_21190 [Pseudomonas sp. JQ170C]|nr:hypothetical protein [Pseudomonas sp. 170C]WRO74993.1 hypothetical protein U9R80_21190 [Pseudomonas sp. 170C]